MGQEGQSASGFVWALTGRGIPAGIRARTNMASFCNEDMKIREVLMKNLKQAAI